MISMHTLIKHVKMSMQRAYKFINKLGGDGIVDKNSFIHKLLLFVCNMTVCMCICADVKVLTTCVFWRGGGTKESETENYVTMIDLIHIFLFIKLCYSFTREVTTR